LILIDHYLPGSKYGGTLRTITSLVEALGDNLEFWVLTNDRDLGETTPYSRIEPKRWSEVGKAKVYYASPEELSLFRLNALLSGLCAEISPDVIFLNGIFGNLTIRSLLLRRLGMFPDLPVLISPRGQLSGGSLQMKSAKKKAYLQLTSGLGCYRGLNWQAASSLEVADIKSVIGKESKVYLSSNIPAYTTSLNGSESKRPKKMAGKLRLVYLSRVSPVKNLVHTLEVLGSISDPVEFDIYGHIDDPEYWRYCQELIKGLPSNIQTNYLGPVELHNVSDTLSAYHFFVLPTLGENFGHAIFEALAKGCPLIISDKTPWRGLGQQGAGWDLPLNNQTLWQDAIKQAIQMDQSAYEAMSQAAHQLSVDWLSETKTVEQNHALFARFAAGRIHSNP
jgi:glycosyltransferase involved in cell wall biosynthesis